MISSHTSVPYPAQIQLANTPTPLHPLDRISKELGGPRIWIKRDDLTGSLLSGNKVRKLEFVVAQALSEKCDTLITCGGVQSNHCRATAFVAAQLGLKAVLLLRKDDESIPDGNLFLDYLAGADVHLYDLPRFRRELPSLLSQHAEQVRAAGHYPFIIPTGASDEIGVWGYVAACEELKADFEKHAIQPQKIFVATGSGGTQAGLTAGSKLSGLNCDVIGMAVCDNEQYFQNKVLEDLTLWQQRYKVDLAISELTITVNDQYIGPGYARATQDVFSCIHWLASREGIVLDPVYTGKAFYGLVDQIKQGNLKAHDDIVFVHTGGMFGLFAQRNAFGF